MHLTTIDWAIIAFFFALTLGIGILVSRRSGKDTSEYFLSGRKMPWWLLGFSMVATTFAADTPLLVTDIVRKDGVAGNWVWWAFLLTGMLTVFVYAKLWRRSGVRTDMEFYELRYGGTAAEFLRVFRALYLGLIFNVLVMSVVTLAAIKIGGIMLGLSPGQIVWTTGIIVVLFSALGGFRGVVYTDFILFVIAMFGAVAAAYYAVTLPEVGGLHELFKHDTVRQKLSMIPSHAQREQLIQLLIIPLAVQWWSSWYPGAEPGGGGYIAQRMLAARDENHAIGATFFFNIMHYAIRPWPWILVGLASLVVFPDLESLQTAFPKISQVGHDMAYPAMLNFLPHGLLGLVLASLIAAYMSTISTHLNWGASYFVNDFYKRLVRPDAPERELVSVGRLSTVLMMVLSAWLALNLNNVKQIFDIVILFGAGTGLIFILRWFWWRINAWSEITAMIVSGAISLFFKFSETGRALFTDHGPLPAWSQYPIVVGLTTAAWLIATFLTRPERHEVLETFYRKIRPYPKGWLPVIRRAKDSDTLQQAGKSGSALPQGILATMTGAILVYAILFLIGKILYRQWTQAGLLFLVSLAALFILRRLWKDIKARGAFR